MRREIFQRLKLNKKDLNQKYIQIKFNKPKCKTYSTENLKVVVRWYNSPGYNIDFPNCG